MSSTATSVLTSLNVVDLAGNPGGGTRFVRALLPAIKRVRPTLHVRFWGTETSLSRGDISKVLQAAGIETKTVTWRLGMNWKSLPLSIRLGYKVRHRLKLEPDLIEFIEKRFALEIAEADVVYFPWPYHIRPPNLSSPLVMTVHDLNFKYFFGAPIVGPAAVEALDMAIPLWLERAVPVTSSKFMAGEMARFYPSKKQVPVIRLAPFSEARASLSDRAALPAAIDRSRYILCPTQVTVHKNLGVLIAAQALLRARYGDVNLVLTGVGSEMATGGSSAIGSIRGHPEPDVIGLGYVANDEIDALIDHAAVVVNPSLYEAGNGSGIDAWIRGSPVAMSDIPSFREHIDALGVEAALFDPRNPHDVAEKIATILDNPAKWAKKAAESRIAISRRTWDAVATEYLQVFDSAVSGR